MQDPRENELVEDHQYDRRNDSPEGTQPGLAVLDPEFPEDQLIHEAQAPRACAAEPATNHEIRIF